MAADSGLLRIASAGCEIAIDDRYAPLYLSRWRGALDDVVIERLEAWFSEIGEANEGAGLRIAYVNDLRELQRGSASVRRAFIESSDRLKRTAHGRVMVGSWHIIEGALIRGALSLVRWVTATADEDHFVGDWAEGIAGARAALTRAGGGHIDLAGDRYEFPED